MLSDDHSVNGEAHTSAHNAKINMVKGLFCRFIPPPICGESSVNRANIKTIVRGSAKASTVHLSASAEWRVGGTITLRSYRATDVSPRLQPSRPIQPLHPQESSQR